MKLDPERTVRARERLGYSMEVAGAEAGLSKNTVLHAEHGADIRPSTARKIADAYGVSVAHLLGEAEPVGAVDFDLERIIEELEEAEQPEDLEELRELVEEKIVPELAQLPRETLQAIEAEKLRKSSRLDKRFNSPDMRDPAKDAEMLTLIEEIRTVRLALYALDRVPA